ncbi:MAG: nitroreductase [Desulfobulbaceae bacterium]|nr:nitroreductase [Desulfobulbaceae bacterium]
MSIRGFKPEPVDRAVLKEVFELARWSPSYKNSQPWEVLVLSGEKKKGLSREMIRLFEEGAPNSPDLVAPQGWPPTEQANINQLYQSRREATGVDLLDPKLVRKAKKANFSFYGAPHAVYLLQDNSLSQWSLFDLGLFAQTLMLAAHAKGLGTVPQAFATDYAGEIKEFLGIPATKRLVLGLSLGYPDPEASLNKLRSDRMAVEKFVRWLE